MNMKSSITVSGRMVGPNGQRSSFSTGFTLVELLVVLFIFLLLTSIALPTVRKLLSDQKTSRAASSITNYINAAKSRAIAEGRYVGVRLERLDSLKAVEYGSSASLRVRQIVGVPPYSGEAADSRVNILFTSGSRIADLQFTLKDNQLLSLGNSNSGPIKDRDLIELPGGRKFHLLFVSKTSDPITAKIDLASPADGSVGTSTTSTFPVDFVAAGNRSVKYRIHRSPELSSTSTLSFARGVAIDLNYSGMGPIGTQFAPQTITTTPPADVNDPIDIVFGPDGRVEFLSTNSLGTIGSPSGIIFLCVGSTDGVRPDDLFAMERRATANILRPDSIWIVINPYTGRTVAAPFAAVSDTSSLTTAISQARSLALLSDTLDAQP